MADGTTRPIDEVNIGDKVATTDPATGEHSDQQVTLLHANRDIELTDVTVSTQPADQAVRSTGEGEGERSTRGPTKSVLHTTEHHPFWDATTGEWVNAADLTPGKTTLVGPDGQIQYVTAVPNFTDAKVMRDLTVANTHTYYVIADRAPVLVHNCNELDSYEHGGTTRYRGRDGLDRPQGASTVITKANSSVRGSDANTKIIPPGWAGDGVKFNQARGHLVGNLLKGSGNDPRNLVTLTHNPFNSPMMRGYERMIHNQAIRNDEIIQYTVTPRYASDYHLVPDELILEAYGNKGFSFNGSVPNPAAWQ